MERGLERASNMNLREKKEIRKDFQRKKYVFALTPCKVGVPERWWKEQRHSKLTHAQGKATAEPEV